MPVTLAFDVSKETIFPSWQPLREMTERHGLEFYANWGGERLGSEPVAEETRETQNPEWYEHLSTWSTPAGELLQIARRSRRGHPSYIVKHLITSVEEARRWLSLPDPQPRSLEGFREREAAVGERGLLRVGIDEPMYAVNGLMGSELWGYWLYDERELLHEMVTKAYAVIERDLKRYLAAGYGPLYGMSGPELCIPPLASVRDFEEFVVKYDRPLLDLVHEGGAWFWVHCHGDMGPVLEGFREMGVDCLNPVEPPPLGSVSLGEMKRRAAGGMTLEGGVESSDFEFLRPGEMEQRVATVLAEMKAGGRFILCPTASPGHWPEMNAAIVENYRAYAEAGLRLGSYA